MSFRLKEFSKSVTEKFSNSIFSMMRKYFSSGFFLNLKSLISAIQRNQPELLGTSLQETARIWFHRPPPQREPQTTIFMYNSKKIGAFGAVPTQFKHEMLISPYSGIWPPYRVPTPSSQLSRLSRHQKNNMGFVTVLLFCVGFDSLDYETYLN